MDNSNYIDEFKSFSCEKNADNAYYIELVEHLRESIELAMKADMKMYGVVKEIESFYKEDGKAKVFLTLKEVIDQWKKDDKVIFIDKAKCFLVLKDKDIADKVMDRLTSRSRNKNCRSKKYQIINASESHKFFLVFSATLENDEELIESTQHAIKKIFNTKRVDTIYVDDDTITFSIPDMTMGSIVDNKLRFSHFISEVSNNEITSRCQEPEIIKSEKSNNMFKKIPIDNFTIDNGLKYEINYDKLFECLGRNGGICNLFIGQTSISGQGNFCQTMTATNPNMNSVMEFVSESSPRDKSIRAYHKEYMREYSRRGVVTIGEREFNRLIESIGWTKTKDTKYKVWSKRTK